MSLMPAVLQLREVSKQFPTHIAVRDLNLEVERATARNPHGRAKLRERRRVGRICRACCKSCVNSHRVKVRSGYLCGIEQRARALDAEALLHRPHPSMQPPVPLQQR